ncbi:nuclear transport factor 2 family protein [Streptomyces sp. NPDC091292]|uniref:nuclear transport factor 2 family protein n=1 Tax=Streptomyces sp. NPDC091292 TaxID=3365991 RepID=UPI0038079E36
MTDLDAARLANIERRLTRLEDIEALHKLRYRYHELVNTNTWEEHGAELFTADAVMDYGHLGVCHGHEEIAAFFNGAAAGVTGSESPTEPPFVKQFIHAHDVRFDEADSDRAIGISFLEAKPVYRGESFLVSGRFDDEYRRVDGRWLFSKVKAEYWFMVPAHEGWASPDRIKMSFK